MSKRGREVYSSVFFPNLIPNLKNPTLGIFYTTSSPRVPLKLKSCSGIHVYRESAGAQLYFQVQAPIDFQLGPLDAWGWTSGPSLLGMVPLGRTPKLQKIEIIMTKGSSPKFIPYHDHPETTLQSSMRSPL